MKNHISVICKKEDFKTSNYIDTLDCALAMALKRAGYKLGYEGYKGAVAGMDVWFGPEMVEYGIVEWDEIIDAYRNPRDLQVNLLLI